MEKLEIKKVLTNPSKEIVEMALGYVNLTEKEKQVLNLCEMQGFTEERASEILEISDRNLRYLKASAFEKLNKVWSYNQLVAMLLKVE